MIADLKPYADYKEVGLPWLGQLPRHWGSRRMKLLFKEQVQKGFPKEPLLAATQSKGVVRKEDYGSRTVIAMNGLENLKLVEVGDFVISLRSFQGGIEVSHARGIISPAYTVLRPRNFFDPGYFKLYFKSAAFVRSMTLFVTGIREGQNIDYERLSRAFMPLPPPDEQAAIVRFLDWANGRLERAVKAKRKVAALLNEQKQTIIHRAVTRGLDPSVPLKPSGIPWLGDIPEHWEVRRLGSLLRERGEVNSNGEVSSVLSLLRSRGVIPYDEKGNVGNKKSDDITRYKIVRPDDIVMNCMNVIIGSVGISRYTGCLSPVYYVLVRRNETDSAHYLNAVFQCSTFYRSLVRIGNGILAHRMRIPMELLKCELLPYPPQTEQVQIVEWLGTATEALDKVINRTEREIQYLREYHTRLVADVVTGKLDVREAAAGLPDEVTRGTVEDAADLGEDLDTADEEATA